EAPSRPRPDQNLPANPGLWASHPANFHPTLQGPRKSDRQIPAGFLSVRSRRTRCLLKFSTYLLVKSNSLVKNAVNLARRPLPSAHRGRPEQPGFFRNPALFACLFHRPDRVRARRATVPTRAAASRARRCPFPAPRFFDTETAVFVVVCP